jgi:2,4-dienoyl-CoA reductase-like NADH-dependent reductase (Old Yellow Enzyme family)
VRSSPVALFTPLTLRQVTLPNRLGVSPMCQYSCQEGEIGPWHTVHLGSRAVGGAGLILAEATAVHPQGRISPADCGLWNDRQAELWRPLVDFLQEHGAVPGIQLAHAGRKAATDLPWQGGRPLSSEQGGWPVVGPSAVPFSSAHQTPTPLTSEQLDGVLDDFVAAAQRAHSAGFQVVELHMAHGYLLHSFLSPLSNRREDEYGGDLEGRMRFPLRVAEAVRAAWPNTLPLFVRLSCTDWVEGGWDLEQSRVFVHRLKELGVDLVDCSSGGTSLEQQIPTGAGYQVGFAASLRQVGLPTAAVGEISEPVQAETILATGQADLILLGRASLRDPYWPLKAARTLGARWQPRPQYARGYPNSL